MNARVYHQERQDTRDVVLDGLAAAKVIHRFAWASSSIVRGDYCLLEPAAPSFDNLPLEQLQRIRRAARIPGHGLYHNDASLIALDNAILRAEEQRDDTSHLYDHDRRQA